MRDLGGLWLGLSALLIYVVIQRTTQLVRVAGLVVVVFSVPHVAYHTTKFDVLGVGDAVANVTSLVFVLVLGLGLLVSPSSQDSYKSTLGTERQ